LRRCSEAVKAATGILAEMGMGLVGGIRMGLGMFVTLELRKCCVAIEPLTTRILFESLWRWVKGVQRGMTKGVEEINFRLARLLIN